MPAELQKSVALLVRAHEQSDMEAIRRRAVKSAACWQPVALHREAPGGHHEHVRAFAAPPQRPRLAET